MSLSQQSDFSNNKAVATWRCLRIITLLLLCNSACQRTAAPTMPAPQAGRTVLVRGGMYYAHEAGAIKGFEAVFMRDLQAPASEQIVTTGMAETGHYQIRLLAGQLYYIKLSLKANNCLMETQEFPAPNATDVTTWTKNFHLDYPDSTEYGGCMAGWRPVR
ncbi:MAG: hypothetical protein M3Y54_05980 [Bacteroidota bacterium]|nr:hypothetical protein [Bacteroidota bacterium]